MSNFETPSKALTYMHAGPAESLAGWDTTARANFTLLAMALVNDSAECFTLATSIDLAHNLMAGCEHYGSEVCECATWGDQA